MVQLIDSDELSLIPGPAVLDEPFYAVQLRVPDPIPIERVAMVLRALPGVREIAPREPKWNDVRYEWESGEFYIRIGMTFFDGTDPAEWAGSPLDVRCLPEHLIAIWDGLREKMPNVWLQDAADSRLYSPRSFVDELASEFGDHVLRPRES
jgi:hypothetical protein